MYYITLFITLSTLLYDYHNNYVLYIIMYYIIILLTYMQHRPPIIFRNKGKSP